MSAIYILWKRELIRYFRSRARLIGSLGQPLLFLVALGFGLGPIFQKAGQGNYFQFLGPGVVCMGILFTGVFAGIQVIWDRQFGFLKETLVAPVTRFEIMFGKTLGGATVAFIQGCFVLILTMIVGFRVQNVLMIPLALIAMFLIALFFTALGISIASILEDMQGFQLILNFIVQPVFFLSGALFPLTGVVSFLSVIAYFNPLAYGVDAVRGSLTGVTHFGLMTDFTVLAIISVIVLSIGSYLFSKVEA
ncbi:MAG TPA: ABC transporter permease [Patescibacteria group bacterium]|nr:ABC transporter permease [Patescibacteria group bacterium]